MASFHFAGQEQPNKNLKANLKNSTPTLTIWVHGTKRLPHIAPLPFVKRFFDCQAGLHPAQTLDPKFHHRSIADSLIATDPHRFQVDHLYLFGWSGELSFQEREQAARDLYAQIKKLVADYQTNHKISPHVRIITHSHGGNVVLNMAAVADAQKVAIDELILLACPVQKKTAKLIKDPMFKKIYALYSVLDMIQVADPQGLYHNEPECPFFSERRFAEQANLKQCEVSIKHRPILHVEFMLAHFLKRLPTILDEMEKN